MSTIQMNSSWYVRLIEETEQLFKDRLLNFGKGTGMKLSLLHSQL